MSVVSDISYNRIPCLSGRGGSPGIVAGRSTSVPRLDMVIAYALVERNAKLLAPIHKAFIRLEVGVVLGHRILTGITLALFIKPPTDFPERLDGFEQRCRVLVGTLQGL